MTGAPGAILQQYGGPQDLVLVGSTHKTAGVASHFYALDPTNGNTAPGGDFDGGGKLGPVLGSPAIDYSTGRVYFASRQLSTGDPTVWCLQVTANVAVPFGTCAGWVHQAGLGSFDTSPTLRNGRLYVANDDVYSLDAASAAASGSSRRRTVRSGLRLHRPGRHRPVLRDHELVWKVSDDGSANMDLKWSWTVDGLNPSLVLFWRERGYLYVGGANGTLWQLSDLDAPSPTATPLVLVTGTAGSAPPRSTSVSFPPPCPHRTRSSCWSAARRASSTAWRYRYRCRDGGPRVWRRPRDPVTLRESREGSRMSEGKDPSAEPATGRKDGRLPYEKPAVAWEQPLEVQPSLMSGCEKQGGGSGQCITGLPSS